MEEYLKWLDANPWLNLVFLILATLSIVVSIFLFRKSRKRRRPVYAKRSVNIISDKVKNVGNIVVTYQGSEIENLTVSKIAIWNSGNDTIKTEDQAPTDKLRISLAENFKFLEYDVLFQSAPSNNVRLHHRNNTVFVEFDYFDPNQGCIVKFLHTGKKSADINLYGTFIGSASLKNVIQGASIVDGFLKFITAPANMRRGRRSRAFKLFPWIVLISGLYLLFISFSITARLMSLASLLLFIGILYTGLGAFMIFGTTRVPKGLDILQDDE